MAVAIESSGSQACTVGTEHTLLDTASVGVREFGVDLQPSAAGDIFELRVYKMFKTSGTRRVIYKETYYGVQDTDDQGKVSVSASTGLTDSGALRFTIKQTQGTSRTIDWEVLKF